MKYPERKNLPEKLAAWQPLVVFDGECSFCNRSIQFLLKHNTSEDLIFTTRTSATGQLAINEVKDKVKYTNALLLIQDNTVLAGSDAAIQIAGHLSYPWRLLGIVRIVPVFLRDFIYTFIAENRYRWFSRKENCARDNGKYRNRFVF